MSYVDLNPVRAAIAATPGTSDYTSIRARIQTWQQAADDGTGQATRKDERPTNGDDERTPLRALLPFRGPERRDAPAYLPFAFHDYLQLVDWASRQIRDDKRGAIADDVPPILLRLGIDPDAYLDRLYDERTGFISAMGRAERLRQAATELGQRFLKGISEANALFPVGAG